MQLNYLNKLLKLLVNVGILFINANIERYFKQHALKIWTVQYTFCTAPFVLKNTQF